MIHFLNHWGRLWAEYFGLAVIQNTIFLGFVFLALFLLRNTAARVKYAITMIGLFKILLPPLLPAPFLSDFSPRFNTTSGPISIGHVKVVSIPVSNPSTALTLSGLIFTVWIILAVLFLIIPVLSTIRLKHTLKNAKGIYSRTIEKNSGNTGIQIYKSDKISMPLTLGIFSKKIYVPILWEKWSPKCQKLILHHELAHIRRHDGTARILQMIAQAVYFFHPLVWLLSRRINETREMACDDVSIATKKSVPLEYSRFLVKIAEGIVQTQTGLTSASALIRQKHELLNRVRYQMEDRMRKISKKKIIMILAGLILLGVLLSWHCIKELPTEPATLPEETEQSPLAKGDDTPVFVPFDEPPEVIGGYAAIQSKIVYPEIAQRAGVEGRVMIWTQIDEEGNVAKTKVMRSLGPNGCDEAAINAIRAVKWIPAKNKGKLVKVWIAVPIDFRLNPNASLKAITNMIDEESSSRQLQQDLQQELTTISEQSGEEKPTFVPFDQPPEPIGGYAAIKSKIVYPEIAKQSGIEGRILIWAQIDEEGNVVRMKVMKSLGPKVFDEAAMNAVRDVKWTPAKNKGELVKVWIAVPVDFRLN